LDYGHPLKFGAFIDLASDSPDVPIARAQLSEELGFDLVTFQDHPYRPDFLDTWTLMSWVAAKTKRVHIAADVLNVPLRPAAVLARAAASLDLLSDGRLDLGLGAGARWDAIEAMGAARLTPGESVEALSEAIDIIRAIWAVSDRGPLRINGDYYQLDGAARGPAPAHNIPIWLGAIKPRMLRLVGRKADGWFPSMHVNPGDLAAGQKIIDAAAIEAGRDPREIVRLANIRGTFSGSPSGFLFGPSEQWVEELLPLALENGVSTFNLLSDEPDMLRQFAQDVAPALREAVASERLKHEVVEGTLPTIFIRSHRREGIDYDEIPASLAGTTIEPGDAGYANARSTYLRGGSPGLVIRPRDTDQVVAALEYARTQPVALGIRSGGHGISGRSTNDGGIIIDLSKLDAIEILDEATRRVRIEPGARWSDVAAALTSHGWALSSGDYGGVGVGGLATAGGIGWLVREHGLTIDHLRAVDMILADGSLVHASETEYADLFWGVRGAGANFGIVTSFEFEVDEVGDIGFAQLVFDATDIAGFLERWGAIIEAAPRDVTSFLIMGRPRSGEPVIAQVMVSVDSDDPNIVLERLQSVATVAPLLDYSAQILPYDMVINVPESIHAGQGEPVTRSALIDHITPDFAAAAQHLIMSGAVFFFQIRSVGGAVADVAPSATAYAHRAANFQVVAFGSNRSRVDRLWDEMSDHFSGLYLSFETDLRPERLHDAFPPETLERLRALKLRYDPDNVFRDNFNIAPSPLPVG
jgi:alkanesulfonate monooxygenase SsuD/methylene tetrahydromethanopterin reductase-like flavin-dependent oxidoreductase (luciferase family)/FAD/FMN-containing dehydrogenase